MLGTVERPAGAHAYPVLSAYLAREEARRDPERFAAEVGYTALFRELEMAKRQIEQLEEALDGRLRVLENAPGTLRADAHSAEREADVRIVASLRGPEHVCRVAEGEAARLRCVAELDRLMADEIGWVLDSRPRAWTTVDPAWDARFRAAEAAWEEWGRMGEDIPGRSDLIAGLAGIRVKDLPYSRARELDRLARKLAHLSQVVAADLPTRRPVRDALLCRAEEIANVAVEEEDDPTKVARVVEALDRAVRGLVAEADAGTGPLAGLVDAGARRPRPRPPEDPSENPSR